MTPVGIALPRCSCNKNLWSSSPSIVAVWWALPLTKNPLAKSCAWMMLVEFADWEHGRKVYTAIGDAVDDGMECLGIDYLSKEETLYIELEDEQQRDDWVRWILKYLANQRVIDSDPELRVFGKGSMWSL